MDPCDYFQDLPIAALDGMAVGAHGCMVINRRMEARFFYAGKALDELNAGKKPNLMPV